MVKQSKLVYVIGSIVIGIITIIAVVAGLMLSGVIDASSHKLVFVSKSEEIVYTGKTLVCNEYELESGELKSGHTAQVVMTGSQTEVGESENTYVVAIFDENGADVTLDYEITTHYGTLKVLPKPLSVKSGDATETYNGEAVKNSEASVTAGELMEGHTIEYIMTGSRTDAGKGDNTFLVVIRDGLGNDVTKNYNVNYTYGVLEVLPMEVAIYTQNRSVDYDGEEHSMPNDQWYYVNANKRPADGLDVQVFFAGSIATVGKVEIKLASVVVKDGDRDVSFNYEFTYAGSELEIKARKITLVSGSASKEFDGEELTNKSKPTIAEGSLADGHDITGYDITGSQTEIGSSSNTMDPDSIVITADGVDVTDNYEITVKEGLLEVTEVGGNQLKDNPNIDEEDPSDSDKSAMDVVVARVTANHNGAMYLRKQSFHDYQGNASNWSIAPQYALTLDDTYGMNYLVGAGLKNREITKLRTAKITPVETAFGYCLPYYYSTVYTGGAEIQESDTVNSGKLTASYSAHYYNVSHTVLSSGHLGEYEDEEVLYDNYVTQTYLNRTSDSAYYKAMSIIDKEGWNKDDDHIIEKVCAYVQNLAVYDIDTDIEERETDVILAMLRNENKAPSERYTALCRHYAGAGVALFRALEIPARYTVGYMIDAKDGEEVEVKVKNGHAWVEIYLSGIGWVPVECTGGSNNGGAASGKPVLILKPVETKERYDNGKLFEPIDKVDVGGSGVKTYESLGCYVDTVDVVGERGEIGKGTTVIDPDSVKICDGNGNDVTSQFELDLQGGTIHIYIYTLTLTTASAEKIYDATPLVFQTDENNSGYELDGERFGDYSYVVELTGKRETVGSSANTAKITIKDSLGADVTDSYLITYKYGTLTIKRCPIKVTAGSLTEYYEPGKVLEIAADDYEISGELACGTHFVEAKVSGSLTSFGTSYTEVEYVRIYNKTDDETEDVTDQYEITYATGILKMILPD